MNNSHLYQVAADYQTLLDGIDSLSTIDDLSEAEKNVLIENSLAGINDQFDGKAMNVAAYIANEELTLASIKTVETRMVKRRKVLDNKIKNLKNYLLYQMFYMEKTHIANDSMVIKVHKNPCRVIVDDQDSIPLKYQNKETVYTVIKSVIAAEIKSGKDIEGAHLEYSQRLSIK